jgi:hypothetical protein
VNRLYSLADDHVSLVQDAAARVRPEAQFVLVIGLGAVVVPVSVALGAPTPL